MNGDELPRNGPGPSAHSSFYIYDMLMAIAVDRLHNVYWTPLCYYHVYPHVLSGVLHLLLRLRTKLRKCSTQTALCIADYLSFSFKLC